MSKNEVLDLARNLQGRVWGFKLSHLFIDFLIESPDILWLLKGYGKLFVDLKFCDIPSQVSKYVRGIKKLSPDIFTIHASGGRKMMEKALEAKEKNCQVFGVTVLTSLTEEECKRIYGASIKDKVIQFSFDSKDSGLDGIVCAGPDLLFLNEIPELRNFKKIVQGARPFWAEKDEHERTISLVKAFRLRPYKIGLGRAVTKPPSNIGGSIEAFNLIIDELNRKLRL